MDPPTVRLRTLVAEGLRSLPRNLFALGGLAVALALLAVAAASSGGPDALQSVLLFSWVCAPLVVSLVLAARIAGARGSRSIESLFTTPVTQRAWLASEAIVGLALVAALLAASLPFVLVQTARLGAPAEWSAYLAAGAGVGLFAVAWGLFCGVVVGGSGAGAAAGLAGAGGALAFGGLVLEGTLATRAPDPIVTTMLHAAHVSPLALAFDAAGITLFGATPTVAWPAGAALAVGTLALFAAAWLAGVRGQSPLGWDAHARGRSIAWLVAALALVPLALPVAMADASYHELSQTRGAFFDAGDEQQIGLAPRGHAADDAVFTPYWYLRSDPLVFGEDNALDLLLLLKVAPDANVTDVRVTLDPSPDVVATLGAPAREGTAHETRGFGFPGDPVGDAGPVYRAALDVRPMHATGIRYAHVPMGGHVSYVANGVTHASSFRITLFMNVPGARSQMLAAGAPLPLACIASLVTRKIRTR